MLVGMALLSAEVFGVGSQYAWGNNVWLNLGHGSSGWALACGSARLLADKMAKQQPQIEYV